MGKTFSHYCTASLIEPDIIMTAAHCAPLELVKSANQDDFLHFYTPVRIVAGCLERDVTDEEAVKRGCQVRYVDATDFIAHPKYNEILYDISIVKLKQPFELTAKIRTICLPPAHAKFQGLATIAGWGKTSYWAQESPILQTAVVRIINNTHCNKYPGGYNRQLVYCIGFEPNMYTNTRPYWPWTGYRSTCGGDSGSPLMMKISDRTQVIGIASLGSKCDGLSARVNTRVDALRDWIDSTIFSLKRKD
jgi:secreted trypsin-like serine protease